MFQRVLSFYVQGAGYVVDEQDIPNEIALGIVLQWRLYGGRKSSWHDM
jgi:hypothetical protein